MFHHYTTMGIKSKNNDKGSVSRDFRLSKLYRGVQLVSTWKYRTNHHTLGLEVRVAS